MSERAWTVEVGDCLEVMRAMPADSVDLVFCSPPYDAARTYGIGFDAEGEAWVEWAKPRFRECLRVCGGLVAWVVDGQTRDYCYTCSPFLLMADLHREGVKFRKPPVFKRVGIPGSGGPDWLRNDWEPVVCASRGRLPWSDNTACGHPPKWAPGGEMSHRLSDGTRRNQWGASEKSTGGERGVDGQIPAEVKPKPGHRFASKRSLRWGDGGAMPAGELNGDVVRVPATTEARARLGPRRARAEAGEEGFDPPAIANPGNVIECVVGGGVMGDDLAHENEAPFPEKLAEFFVKSFCPPGGMVLDCFGGSGTTGKVAVQNGRRATLIDIRPEMGELIARRIRTAENPQTFRDDRVLGDAPLFAP